MAKAFVTGGTGFLGRTLIERLHGAGWQINALYRGDAPPSFWTACDVAPVRGDLTDTDRLSRYMPEDMDAVFHLAADTSVWRRHRDRQFKTNVTGTKALLDASMKQKARRFIHVSSVSVWGHHRSCINEQTEKRGQKSWVGYVRTKALAEGLVLEAAENGQDAVIINPSHILGRYDTHNWARLFSLIAQDDLPGVPPGGGCFANAGNIADALIKAVENGAAGENYILGGPHASFLDVAREIARLLGEPEPKRAMPAILLKTVARISGALAEITGREPDITPEAAYFVCHDETVSSSKAKAVLGYEETPLQQSLRESYDWLRAEGHLPQKTAAGEENATNF